MSRHDVDSHVGALAHVYDGLPAEQQAAIDVALRSRLAGATYPAAFKGWWFLDTNCISEIAKACERGRARQVISHFGSAPLLMGPLVLLELRRSQALLDALELAAGVVNLFAVTSAHGGLGAFKHADWSNAEGRGEADFSSIKPFPVVPGSFSELLGSGAFDSVCEGLESAMVAGTVSRELREDVGQDVTEQQLARHIFSKVGSFAEDEVGEAVHPLRVRPDVFPAFYAYWYGYWLGICGWSSPDKPNRNTLIDLFNIYAAPYCARFYTEAWLAETIRKVKGKRPPSIQAMMKKLEKVGAIDSSIRREMRRHQRHLLTQRTALLPDLEVWTHGQLQRVLGADGPQRAASCLPGACS